MFDFDANIQKMISCFFTDNYFYICFFTKRNLKLAIYVYNPLNNDKKEHDIYPFSEAKEKRFYKGIHLKGEIGFFSYFENDGYSPTFSLYTIKPDKNIEIYKTYSGITVSKNTFLNTELVCDLIKLNNNTVIFISFSTDQIGLHILAFSLYDNDNYMNIRYFYINVWEENGIKFYCDLRLSLFNNFLLMAFSHCDQEICSESQTDGYEHFSSLIFFNYPNINNPYLDIMEYIYPYNKNIQDEIIIDFEKYVVIENNLFGYVFKGTKIISYPNELNLILNENNLQNGNTVSANENVTLKFNSIGFYSKGNYNIEIAFIVTEPDFGTHNDHLESIDQIRGNALEDEELYFTKYEYIGKNSDLKVILLKDLTNECTMDKCSLCYEEDRENCVTCRYDFDYNEETKIKTCHNIETQKIEQIPTTILISETTQIPETTHILTETPKTTETLRTTNQKIIDEIITTEIIHENSSSCGIVKIISGKCHSKLTSDQLKKLYEDLKSHISENASEIIATENVIFQISSLSEQKENDNTNISSTDLGECEKILKNNSGLTEEDELIVYKIDIKNEDLSFTYVQYEIYNPKNLEDPMSLDACEDVSIIVNVPVKLDENTQTIYNRLSKSGYNLFDLEDDFYNDICSTYTTNYGTDLTLSDRKKVIYDTSGDITMCQEGCTFQSYNLTTRKSQCD